MNVLITLFHEEEINKLLVLVKLSDAFMYIITVENCETIGWKS